MLLCVSRNHAECQSGMSGTMPSGGVAIGAVFLRSENALHEVPRKGYVFHGMGPSCSHGKRGQRGGGGGGTRPRWLALLARGGAYWPLALGGIFALCAHSTRTAHYF